MNDATSHQKHLQAGIEAEQRGRKEGRFSPQVFVRSSSKTKSDVFGFESKRPLSPSPSPESGRREETWAAVEMIYCQGATGTRP